MLLVHSPSCPFSITPSSPFSFHFTSFYFPSNRVPFFEEHILTSQPPGKPVSHAFAKELLAGIAGAEVDKLVETKGMDFIDREKAKRHAQENVEHMYDEHYVRGQGADQYDP